MRSLLKLAAAALLALPLLAGAAGPVNVNTADAETLAQVIKGVGKAKAEAIIAFRQEHGPFASVDDLAQVPGIGAKTVDDNRHLLTVGGD